MIYKGLNRISMIGDIKTNGGGEIAEVYGGIGESNPIYCKQREMVGTSPMQFNALGLPLKDYRIYGETLQDGTPSPDMPVDVVGCGARTENLADLYGVNKTGLNLTFTTGNNMSIKINGTKVDGLNVQVMAQPNIVLPAGVYTVKIKMIGGSITNITGGVMFGINASTYGMRTKPGVNTIGKIGTETFTLNEDTVLASLDITPSYADVGAVFNDAEFECWLYKGSTDLPYEPYGYKLPVTTTNGTDTVSTPIYIGSEPLHRIGEYADYVDYSSGKIMRRIKKLVLTGKDGEWFKSSTRVGSFYLRATDNLIAGFGLCDRAVNVGNIGAYSSSGKMLVEKTSVSFFAFNLWLFDTDRSLADFKAYLAAQYTAGTPVTVWYVLSEPIEEDPPVPLPEIPTLSGTNTLTVDTTVKPSRIDLTGRIKTSGYGQLLDKNSTAINDSTGTPIFIRG